MDSKRKVAGKVDTISQAFKWEIENFCISCKNVGDRIYSPSFTTTNSDNSNIKWVMQFYPKGKVEMYNEEHLSVFLFANTEIRATVEFKILNNEGKVVVDKRREEQIYGKGTGHGFNDLISRDFVVNPVNRILNGDKITIACEIKYGNNEIKYNKAKKRKIDDHANPACLEDKYEALLNDNKFSDVALISEGKTIKVHKCILARSSPVFCAMFNAEMKENQENTVEIADVKYDVLMEMIRFVYIAKVNNIDALAGELVVAADKYALDELKNMCKRTLMKNLNVDNVIVCLQLADRLCMDQLKKKAIEFIVENVHDFNDKSEFKLLPNNIMCELFFYMANKNPVICLT